MSAGKEDAIEKQFQLLDSIRRRRLQERLWTAMTMKLHVLAEATDLGKALAAVEDLNRLIAQTASFGATRGTAAYRTPLPTETERLLAAGIRNLTILYRDAAPSATGDKADPAEGSRLPPSAKQ